MGRSAHAEAGRRWAVEMAAESNKKKRKNIGVEADWGETCQFKEKASKVSKRKSSLSTLRDVKQKCSLSSSGTSVFTQCCVWRKLCFRCFLSIF